jgi:pyrimidine operon attenuation protein/uracil phosphoribosyltransferase
MKILNEHQIQQKIQRLAIQILENNFEEQELILAGINNNGLTFAKMLLEQLEKISDIQFTLTQIKINPADPTQEEVLLQLPIENVRNRVIIIIDDVANTGRTIFYGCKPLLQTLPKKVEAAVLVDRKHKSFPIKVDYVGLSLATTLMENIDVQIREVKEAAVYLN